MRRQFPAHLYRRRSLIECIISTVKRKLSARAPGRLLLTSCPQALLLSITDTLYRLQFRARRALEDVTKAGWLLVPSQGTWVTRETHARGHGVWFQQLFRMYWDLPYVPAGGMLAAVRFGRTAAAHPMTHRPRNVPGSAPHRGHRPTARPASSPPPCGRSRQPIWRRYRYRR
jgi:hypothetical protein